MKALPLALIPFLVPAGTPNGTAKEMGAGEAVTGEGGVTDDSASSGDELDGVALNDCAPQQKSDVDHDHAIDRGGRAPIREAVIQRA